MLVGCLTMFESQSKLIANIKKKILNAVGSHCGIHREALSSRTLPIATTDKLTTIIPDVNYVKANADNIKLFTMFCKKMDFYYGALFFHISVLRLSKVNR